MGANYKKKGGENLHKQDTHFPTSLKKEQTN